jgi:FSR family fosmidomycin resistance protein-like MFS transporter
MVVVLALRLNSVLDGGRGRQAASKLPTGDDEWPAFWRLTVVVVIRSIMFFGITSFLALYVIHQLHASVALGGAALTTFLVSGAIGTLLGGWIADRTAALTSVRIGFALAVPALVGLVLAGNLVVCFVFVVLAGIASYLPFSVFVILGQDYLPNRIGTASGVTVGLAVSVGGLFNPVFGALADATSLRTMLTAVIALPAIALVMSMFLREPAVRRAVPPGDLPLE